MVEMAVSVSMGVFGVFYGFGVPWKLFTPQKKTNMIGFKHIP